MWRACWLAPLAVLLWRLAPLAAAAAKYTDPDGWGPAEECVNWNEDDGIMGGFQPVDDFQEYVNPDVLYPATLAKLGMSLPVWKKCCMPSFNLLQACYQVGFPMPPDFRPPDFFNVHAVIYLRCQMTCGMSGRLRALPLAPVTVDVLANVPIDAKIRTVEFSHFKIKTKTKTLPLKTRHG